MIGYVLDRGSSQGFRICPKLIFDQKNGKGFWRFGTDLLTFVSQELINPQFGTDCLVVTIAWSVAKDCTDITIQNMQLCAIDNQPKARSYSSLFTLCNHFFFKKKL